MTRPLYLLDTNILTGVLKKDARIVNRLTEVLAAKVKEFILSQPKSAKKAKGE